jgi:hypothetical protein
LWWLPAVCCICKESAAKISRWGRSAATQARNDKDQIVDFLNETTAIGFAPTRRPEHTREQFSSKQPQFGSNLPLFSMSVIFSRQIDTPSNPVYRVKKHTM